MTKKERFQSLLIDVEKRLPPEGSRYWVLAFNAKQKMFQRFPAMGVRNGASRRLEGKPVEQDGSAYHVTHWMRWHAPEGYEKGFIE